MSEQTGSAPAAAMLGGLFAGRVARRLGIGPVILLGSSVFEVSRVLIPLAGLSETMTPLGAALGGYLGTAVGLRPTLVVGALVSIISCLFLVASPIRGVRDLPTVAPT